MNHTPPRETVLQNLRRHSQATAADFVRRSQKIGVAKRVLPAAGLLLLAALIAAPELRSGPEADRVAYKLESAATLPASKLMGAKYHGVDQQGQPYTVTADSAVELGPDDVALAAPMGDITLKSGAWLMLKAARGTFRPHSDRLELKGSVTLYRNDGMVLTTPDMEVDMHAGSAQTNSPTAVQGSFGTLNAANGFTLSNRGANVTFKGPATLVLTQGK